MKILITGGSGFIGSNLCKTLADLGHIVYCLDDFSSSNKSNISNVKGLIHLINHDIREKIDLYDIDQIYNFASPPAPNHYKKDPLKTLETNIYGTKNVLDLSTKLNIPILHTSSIRVFDTNHLGTNSCYTEGKRIAETLCKEYYMTYGTQVKIARLNSVYGSNMSLNDSRVVPQFIIKSLKNENLIICGNGDDIETFCYINDVLDAMMRFMKMSYNGTPVNIEGNNVSLIDLANLIIELTCSKSKIIFNGVSIGKNFQIKGGNIKEIMDWSPKIGLREGLISTINYYRSIIT